jgi:hypothetical protein
MGIAVTPGEVTLSEIHAALRAHFAEAKKNPRQVFESLDADQSGSLSHEEVRQAAVRRGAHCHHNTTAIWRHIYARTWDFSKNHAAPSSPLVLTIYACVMRFYRRCLGYCSTCHRKPTLSHRWTAMETGRCHSVSSRSGSQSRRYPGALPSRSRVSSPNCALAVHVRLHASSADRRSPQEPEPEPEAELPSYIRTLGIFRALPRAQQVQVVEAMGEPESYPKGRVVFHEGDPGTAFYLIENGKVAVTKGDMLLVTLGSKEYFGELALMEDDVRKATVTSKPASPPRLIYV